MDEIVRAELARIEAADNRKLTDHEKRQWAEYMRLVANGETVQVEESLPGGVSKSSAPPQTAPGKSGTASP